MLIKDMQNHIKDRRKKYRQETVKASQSKTTQIIKGKTYLLLQHYNSLVWIFQNGSVD